MNSSLLNKNIVVIGAGSSVGKVLCQKLSDAKANVYSTSRSVEKLNAFGLENLIKYQLDLENPDEVKEFAKKIQQGLKHIDGLVVCSGTDISSPLKLTSQEMIEKAFQVNVFSVMEIVKNLLFTRKIDSDGSSVVLITSVAAKRGFFGKTVYSAYKGALVSFARSLALEVSARKIRVNTISPGTFLSDMSEKVLDSIEQEQLNLFRSQHPLGFGSPENIADAILFLLSDNSQWITGTDMIVDGGFTIK